MNIITNKNVFSDENPITKQNKKNSRQRSTPAPRTSSKTAQDQTFRAVGSQSPAETTPSTQSSSQNQNQNQNNQTNYRSFRRPNNQNMNNNKPSEEGSKTVFYQAAKPRNPQAAPNDRVAERPQRSLPVDTPKETPATNPPFQVNTLRGNANSLVNNYNSRIPKRVFNTPLSQITKQTNSGLKLKIIPLGGLEEIGKNMTVFEYGNDIFIVDMGLLFPDSDMPGIDYIIPDATYLQDKKDKIRGIFITHGHLDHTGATPYLIEKLGFPPIYGSNVTIGMIRLRLEEFGLVAKSRLNVVKEDHDVIQMGQFRVFPFHLCHNIPGTVGLEIESPAGRIVLATDWKFDYTPADENPVDLQLIATIGSRGVDLLMSDSTNSEKPGKSISEKKVGESLAEAINESTGRTIIAMFSTNLSRIQQTFNIAHKMGKKVLIAGRSIQQNTEMAVSIKAISLPPNTLISEKEINRFDESKIVVICTGSQGEDRSALMRMASGEHRVIKIKKNDTVIISASPIPGNEKSVGVIMNMLYKAGAKVIYNKTLDVHSSGHAYQEDLKLMLALIKPKYFLPIHGDRNKLVIHGKLAVEVGVPEENILIGENGAIVEMDNNGKAQMTEGKVPAGYVMVDGLGVGDVGSIVLKDRQAMAQEGIFVIINVFDRKKGKFVTSPDIISRGFIYMRENEQFVNDIRNEIKKFLTKAAASEKVDLNQTKNDLRDYIGKFLYEKTERSPIVIPVMIEV